MSLDLTTIAALIAAAAVIGALPGRARPWALLIGSLVAIYWLQPPLAIRFSDFLLPTAAILISTFTWWLTRPPDAPAFIARADMLTLGVVIVVVVLMALTRFIDADLRLTASRPPDPLALLIGIGAAIAVGGGAGALGRRFGVTRGVLNAWLLTLVGIFVVLKWSPAGDALSGVWRGATGQDTTLASALDLGWLGFSYLAFRLIHTIRDRISGLLPALSLRDYLTYAVFAPAYTAGPIDRAERFAGDLAALPEAPRLPAADWETGARRIAIGLFKKFVIADTLALGLALDPRTAALATDVGGMWLLLYGYALRLWLDFSGYSDIAIGIARLVGIRLPENFANPYAKTTITAFWQSWHMTLSSWARFYIFTPLSRALLMRDRKPSPAVIVGIAHAATMIVIGLWHGVSLNFILWGAWHALGLFVHKQWSDRTRVWYRGLNAHPLRKRAWTAFAWFLTLHYVILGWVWFALPDTGSALRTFARLFGVLP